MAKLGNFNASRVATEDYLKSRRIFKTTSAGNTHDEDSMEVDVISRKGKCKEKSSKKYGHKAADCWYKQPPKHQGKGKSTGKSKSKVTEISEIDSSEQVEETWTSNTSRTAAKFVVVSELDWMQETSVHSEWEDQSGWKN